MVAEEVKRISRPEMQLMGVKTVPQEINPDLIEVIRKLVSDQHAFFLNCMSSAFTCLLSVILLMN